MKRLYNLLLLSLIFSITAFAQQSGLKDKLSALPGVTSVSVSSGGQLAVDYDATGVRQADILEKIQALGYHVRQEHA